MPDNLNIRQPQDGQEINVHQQWELDYWTKILRVSEATLKAAVAKVGPLVSDVKKHLKK